MMTGMYHLKTEEANLADRAAEKETTGRTSRKKMKFGSEPTPNQLQVDSSEESRGEMMFNCCGFSWLDFRGYSASLRYRSEYIFEDEISEYIFECNQGNIFSTLDEAALQSQTDQRI